MFDIVFFQRQSKFLGGKVQEKWAKLILNEDDWSNVEEKDEEKTFTIVKTIKDGKLDHLKISDIPILETDCADIEHTADNDAITTVENLLANSNLKPEVILSVNLRTMYEIVKETTPEEFKLNVVVTPARALLFYAICGEDKSVLLVAYSDQSDLD